MHLYLVQFSHKNTQTQETNCWTFIQSQDTDKLSNTEHFSKQIYKMNNHVKTAVFFNINQWIVRAIPTGKFNLRKISDFWGKIRAKFLPSFSDDYQLHIKWHLVPWAKKNKNNNNFYSQRSMKRNVSFTHFHSICCRLIC